jgi:hypothetical protein
MWRSRRRRRKIGREGEKRERNGQIACIHMMMNDDSHYCDYHDCYYHDYDYVDNGDDNNNSNNTHSYDIKIVITASTPAPPLRQASILISTLYGYNNSHQSPSHIHLHHCNYYSHLQLSIHPQSLLRSIDWTSILVQ